MPDAAPPPGSAPMDPAALLAETAAFRELAPGAREALAERMRVVRYAAGERILTQGDEGDGLVVLGSGRASVLLRDQHGGHHALAEVGRGDVLGEMALVTGAPRTADVVARTAAAALVLRAQDFRELVGRHPRIAVLLTNLVAERLGRAAVDGLGDKVLEGYRVRRPRGRGAMAVVYEAEELASGERVALKMMSHRLAMDPAACDRFEREADVARALRHPAIAGCRGRFAAYGTWFLVLEYCDGATLAEHVAERHPLAFDEVRRIAREQADALRHLHERGFVHGDVKPANVMVNLDGAVKLTDFGLSSARDACADEGAPSGGTPRYMPPERLLGARPSPADDVHAFGCVLHELVTGRPAFPAESLGELLASKRDWSPPAPEALRPGLPADLHDALVAALDPDPGRRRLPPLA